MKRNEYYSTVESFPPATIRRMIGSSDGDCAPSPSHTTVRTVFRIRRLNAAALDSRKIGSRTSLSVWRFAKIPPSDRRRPARCGCTASASAILASTAFAALGFQVFPGFPSSSSSSSVLSFFGPLLHHHYSGFFATTASDDFFRALTRKTSPGEVRNLSSRAVRLAPDAS